MSLIQDALKRRAGEQPIPPDTSPKPPPAPPPSAPEPPPVPEPAESSPEKKPSSKAVPVIVLLIILLGSMGLPQPTAGRWRLLTAECWPSGSGSPSGATVIEIGEDTVILEYNSERRTFSEDKATVLKNEPPSPGFPSPVPIDSLQTR